LLVLSEASSTGTAKAFFQDIILGIVGAVAGGYLFNFFGAGRVTRLNLYSVLVATVGAIVVLVVYHGIRRITGHHAS